MKITKTVPTMLSFVYLDNGSRYLRGEAGSMWIELDWDGETNIASEVTPDNIAFLESKYSEFLNEFNA